MKSVTKGILCILLLAFVLTLCACGGEKIVWADIVLGSMLPEPPVTKGEIHDNSADELWIRISSLSDKQYADYVEACKDKGFTIDAESNSSSYVAYNADGYKLELSHYGNDSDMRIQLEKPMEMDTIKWPTSAAGTMLPTPKSTKGVFSYEHDDNFFVYIGDTSKADYNAYVEACSEKGFHVDYDKGEDFYFADNSEGWHISIRYEGNNIMSIDIDAPAEEIASPATEEPTIATGETVDTTDAPTQAPTEAPTEAPVEEPVSGIRPEFKEAMDSYEEFMDEYVDFMKKYKKSNGTDLSLLADYAKITGQYAEFSADFAKWDDAEMSTEEAEYYLEVLNRVNKKLLEVAA